MSDAIAEFIDKLGLSLSARDFVKLTLSNYRGAERHLQKVTVRPINTKKGQRLLFQYRYDNRDVAKNYDVRKTVGEVRTLIDSGFRSGHLFSTSSDYQLTIGKKRSRIVSGKPAFKDLPTTSHDRKRRSLIEPTAFYLKPLGITTDAGEVRSQQHDKWRQINKYVEILASLVDKSSLKDEKHLRIVDMGSGKGYLTFAAYDYFANIRGLNVQMTGVDTRQELIDLCNQIADAGGFEGLRFVNGTIADFEIGETDILIALHACDTATDDALFKGVAAGAEIIVAAPCCHKELRPQINAPGAMRDILKHGTMLERAAEMITDGLRAMLLERRGYTTRVFEFISTEHTPKNNMIAGVRTHPKPNVDIRVESLLAEFGITSQRLYSLLSENTGASGGKLP